VTSSLTRCKSLQLVFIFGMFKGYIDYFVLGMYRKCKKVEFPKKVIYMNLEATRLRDRPRNRWQDEVREGGGLVGGRKGCITERNGRSS